MPSGLVLLLNQYFHSFEHFSCMWAMLSGKRPLIILKANSAFCICVNYWLWRKNKKHPEKPRSNHYLCVGLQRTYFLCFCILSKINIFYFHSEENEVLLKTKTGTSLVMEQLSMRATTTEARMPGACAPQERPLQWEALTPQWGAAPTHRS